MKELREQCEEAVRAAFVKAGYDAGYGIVTVSNRPDLCQYQCNGALSAARTYHKAPLLIAKEVVEEMTGDPRFRLCEAAAPGFINLTVRESFLASYANEMKADSHFGAEAAVPPETIMLDYGGPNVAKPLHVGHLRSAVIGESIKRILRFFGHNVIGDVHLGDWGLQMGLIITELKERQPDLVYFDPDYTGAYPADAPFTIGELEEIYPAASARSKVDEAYKEAAHDATYQLQHGNRGYLALWQHIVEISVADLKKNYENLNVTFDLWKKESDAQPYIPDMVAYLRENGYAHESQGALVVDVREETDTKEIPPCMILKSDGATLYNTTDLATIVEREKLFSPDRYIYVVDKRQDLYFEQIFRCARKTHLVRDGVELTFLGFGTMNGKDGKPFKTREGGVMRLSDLIEGIQQAVREKMDSSRGEERALPEEETETVIRKVSVAALKYGDLSNQASKDYIFDTERFASFDGNTGPYILYTIARIHSILRKYEIQHPEFSPEYAPIRIWEGDNQTELLLQLCKFNQVVKEAAEELAPHKICQYVYELSNLFNKFYHETRILAEEDESKRHAYLALLSALCGVMETCADLLGIETVERM